MCRPARCTKTSSKLAWRVERFASASPRASSLAKSAGSATCGSLTDKLKWFVSRRALRTDGKSLNASASTGASPFVAMANSTMLAIHARLAAYSGQVVTWDQAVNSQENLTPAKWEWGPAPVAPVPHPGSTKLI